MKIFMRVLWMVGLLAWSCCFALGFNYGHGDSLMVSLILLLAVLGIMGVDVFLLNKYANPKQGSNNKQNFAKWEMVCLVLYAVMVVLTISGVAHFVTVQTTVKSEVRPEALSRIQELRRVFGTDNVEGSYQAYVAAMSQTYRNAMKKNYADEGTVNVAVAEFEDEMMGQGDYELMRNQALAFLDKCEYTVLNWIPWNVTEYLSELDENLSNWEAELVALSEKNEWVIESNELYNPRSEATDSLASRVIHSKVADFGALSIVLIVVMQILILLSYLRTKKWFKDIIKPDDPNILVYHREEAESRKRIKKAESDTDNRLKQEWE